MNNETTNRAAAIASPLTVKEAPQARPCKDNRRHNL